MAISIANGFGWRREWIEQALAVLPEEPDIFSRERLEDAMLRFGLGNKKVEALRNWIRAMDLARSQGSVMHLTPFGQAIRRLDPSLRAAPTLWLLHLQLSLPAESVQQRHQVWEWFASAALPDEFTQEYLRSAFRLTLPAAKDSALRNGVSELVGSLRNTPLGNMGLLREKDKRTFVRYPASCQQRGTAILLMAVARQMERLGRTSLGFAELVGPGGAGRILGLPFSTTVRVLEEGVRQFDSHGVRLSRTAGLNTLWMDKVDVLYWYLVAYGEAIGQLDDPSHVLALLNSFVGGGLDNDSAQ